jgi:hypothetical protein
VARSASAPDTMVQAAAAKAYWKNQRYMELQGGD